MPPTVDPGGDPDDHAGAAGSACRPENDAPRRDNGLVTTTTFPVLIILTNRDPAEQEALARARKAPPATGCSGPGSWWPPPRATSTHRSPGTWACMSTRWRPGAAGSPRTNEGLGRPAPHRTTRRWSRHRGGPGQGAGWLFATGRARAATAALVGVPTWPARPSPGASLLRCPGQRRVGGWTLMRSSRGCTGPGSSPRPGLRRQGRTGPRPLRPALGRPPAAPRRGLHQRRGEVLTPQRCVAAPTPRPFTGTGTDPPGRVRLRLRRHTGLPRCTGTSTVPP